VAVTLSGCSTFGLFSSEPEKEVVVQTEYVEKKIPLQAKPKPMTLNDVTWYVVTEENFDEFLEKYKKENGDAWVFYAISVRSYEAMAINMAEIQRYLQSQNAIIVYYENAINPPKENGDAEAPPSNKAEQ
jgi:hypothetical protein